MAGFPLPLDYGMACVRSERREDGQERERDAVIAQVLFLKGPAGRRTVVQETREGDICLQAVAVREGREWKVGRLVFPFGALQLAFLRGS